MKGLAGLLLLALGACSAPGRDSLSVGAPEERHQRMLDRLAGVVPAGFPEEFWPPPRTEFPELLEIRIGGIEAMPRFREPEYGLYANPIP